LIYQITDNDLDVVARFQDTTVTIDEGGGVASVVVELNNTAGKDVVVDYQVNVPNSTATGGGTDYSLANGSITISAGDEFETINVALTDDDIEEIAETIEIGISGDKVLANQADTIIITISDNDALSGFYGPGGVGNNENNLLWLDAFNVNGRGLTDPVNGDNVSAWVDNSGNGFDFTATGANPTYVQNGFNNLPTVNISNSQLGFTAPSTFSNALSNYTMIFVGNQNSGDYLAENNTAGNGVFRLNTGGAGLFAFSGTNYMTGLGTTNNHLSTWMFDIQANDNATYYRNGTSIATNANYNVMALANNFSLGNRYTGPSAADFAGNISEFIIYSNPINEAQRIIVENYLAAKYGLSINNDLYSYQGTFFYDVVGVGSLGSSGGQHLEAMSDSLLLISNPADLDSGEFVFMGHDNGAKLSWTTFEAPLAGNNVRRIAREWRIDTIGNPGAVVLKIDANELPTPENGFTQYALYVDKDGNFSNGATIYQLDFSVTSGLYVTDPIDVDKGDYLTIGVLKPIIQFALSSSDSSESFTNPKIEVSLNFVRDENVTVDYEASGGTASGDNVDYLLTDGTLTIAPGNLLADIDLGIIDDALEESAETIEITLSNPSSNVSFGSNVAHTYTIIDNDNDRQVRFAFSDSTVNENDISADSIAVQLLLLNQAGDDTVQSAGDSYVILDIGPSTSAIFETDYDTLGVFRGDTLYFAPGDSIATFQLQITNDALFESNEDIVFRISNTNENVGSTNEVVFTIGDDDTEPEVTFVETEAFGQESISPVQIELALETVSGTQAEIFYTVSSSNATPGDDFDLEDGSVLIEPGESETSILLTINNDGILETGESIEIQLTSADGASLGSPTTFTYTILDDDNTGFVGPGGVGDATDNLLWLRADYYTTGVGWADTSGNNHDATIIDEPTLTGSNAGYNQQATLGFDGSNSLDVDALSSDAGDYDIFLVYGTSVTSPQQLFSSDGGLIVGHELGYGYADEGGTQGTEFTGTTKGIYQYALQSGAGNAVMRLNGVDNNTSTYTQTDITADNFIGSSVTSTQRFNGDLAEIILYDKVLNSAQRKIVENYLSSRYDISIGGNDLFDETGGFTEDLAGIGRDSASALHTEASSADQVRIGNANDLATGADDGEYMLFAHNDGSTDVWQTTTNPGILRLDREWKFDIIGDPGSVTITLDTTALDTISRTTFPTYAILVSASGDYDNPDHIYSLTSVGGSEFEADGISFDDGDRFVIGTIRNISQGTGGDFSNTGTWTTGIVPGSGDDVFIDASDSVFLTSDVTIGSLTIEDGGELVLNGFTLSLDQACISFNGDAELNVSYNGGGEIEYSAPADQCVSALTYDDVSFTTSGRKFLLGDIDVNGDLEINNNFVELDAEGHTISFAGNWDNQGTFTADNGRVVVDGSSAQTLSANTPGGENFYQLVINKPGGTLTLSSTVNVEDSLAINQGILNIDDNDLYFTNVEASHLSGGGNSNYIQANSAGEIIISVSDDQNYSIPVGDNDEYSPIEIDIPSGQLTGNGPTISVNVRDSKYSDITTDYSYISRYWIVEGANISDIEYNLVMHYTDADVSGGSENTLEPIKFDGGNVDDISEFQEYAINASQNQISWDSLVSFSAITAGVQDDGVPLPVTLLYFKAELINGNVWLKWETATEINNDHFVVLKSTDGQLFEKIGQIEGNGNTSNRIKYDFVDRRPQQGITYYQLMQVDFDGTEHFSDILTFHHQDLQKELRINLYPNPTDPSNINLEIFGAIKDLPIHLRLFNLQGKIYFDEIIDHDELDLKIEPLLDMEDGVYFLAFQQGKVYKTLKLVIRRF
jgi:hypothetical protein